MTRRSLCSCLFVALLLISQPMAFAEDVGGNNQAGDAAGEAVRPMPEPGPGETPAPDSQPPETDFARDPFGEESPPPRLADPLEPLNRALFVFNDKAYYWVMKPVAQGYAAIVPETARVSVRNFFRNITMPVRFVNNLLQGKIRNSGIELLRFLINTTTGIGGLFDPAKNDWHIEPRDGDLGQTLGKYGLGHGFYLVLPFLGPSSLRDTVGLAGDFFLNPVNYIDDDRVVIGAHVLNTENEVSLRIGEYEDLTKSALDPYVAVRDAYSQHRAKKVEE
ncbi:MAG: MlaA family lipoprotein [Candidatus Deferrimicrobiaceae bacterium]